MVGVVAIHTIDGLASVVASTAVVGRLRSRFPKSNVGKCYGLVAGRHADVTTSAALAIILWEIGGDGDGIFCLRRNDNDSTENNDLRNT